MFHFPSDVVLSVTGEVRARLKLLFLVLQLVDTENVRAVITMNEMYETKYFCNSAEVGLLHLYVQPGEHVVCEELCVL